MKLKQITFALVFALGSACALAAPAVAVKNGVLTANNGMSLYTFDNDAAGSGKSVCNGPCATNWPPLMAKAGETGGNYSVVVRDDGAKQVAYKGKPLYFFVKDQKAGDISGDGVKNVWHLAKP